MTALLGIYILINIYKWSRFKKRLQNYIIKTVLPGSGSLNRTGKYRFFRFIACTRGIARFRQSQILFHSFQPSVCYVRNLSCFFADCRNSINLQMPQYERGRNVRASWVFERETRVRVPAKEGKIFLRPPSFFHWIHPPYHISGRNSTGINPKRRNMVLLVSEERDTMPDTY